VLESANLESVESQGGRPRASYKDKVVCRSPVFGKRSDETQASVNIAKSKSGSEVEVKWSGVYPEAPRLETCIFEVSMKQGIQFLSVSGLLKVNNVMVFFVPRLQQHGEL